MEFPCYSQEDMTLKSQCCKANRVHYNPLLFEMFINASVHYRVQKRADCIRHVKYLKKNIFSCWEKGPDLKDRNMSATLPIYRALLWPHASLSSSNLVCKKSITQLLPLTWFFFSCRMHYNSWRAKSKTKQTVKSILHIAFKP